MRKREPEARPPLRAAGQQLRLLRLQRDLPGFHCRRRRIPGRSRRRLPRACVAGLHSNFRGRTHCRERSRRSPGEVVAVVNGRYRIANQMVTSMGESSSHIAVLRLSGG